MYQIIMQQQNSSAVVTIFLNKVGNLSIKITTNTKSNYLKLRNYS
jgi:hypothetical protein